MANHPIWFSPKRSGVGIRPSHPVGWLLTGIFILVLLASVQVLLSASNVGLGLGMLLVNILWYAVAVWLTKA